MGDNSATSRGKRYTECDQPDSVPPCSPLFGVSFRDSSHSHRRGRPRCSHTHSSYSTEQSIMCGRPHVCCCPTRYHSPSKRAPQTRRPVGSSFRAEAAPVARKGAPRGARKTTPRTQKKKKTAGRSSVQKLTKVILEKVLCLFGEVCELDWHGDMLDLRCAAKHNRAIGKHQQLRLAGATAWGN